MPQYRPLIERFWDKVDKQDGPDCCWLWKAALHSAGYGVIGVDAYSIDYAHRVSWKLHFGEIPEGLNVCHTCDNPTCVNPYHLFLGSDLENKQDSMAKHRHNFGEHNGRSKLTAIDVQEIRRAYSKGEKQAALAERFNVSQSHISGICSGTFWKDAASIAAFDELKPCQICGRACTGSIGAAGIKWPSLCTKCKDAEDDALRYQLEAMKFIDAKLFGNTAHPPSQNNLPVPVLADPTLGISPYGHPRSGEARESTNQPNDLFKLADSRGGQSLSYVESFSAWLDSCNDSLPEPESFSERLEQTEDGIE